MEHTNNQYSRGQDRGRGRRGYGQRLGVPSTPRLPDPDANQKCLRVMSASTVQSRSRQSEPSQVRIQQVQYVASYNWIDKDLNTILVPGKPPKWLPPTGRQRLHEDNGSYYRDPNAARFPSYPIEPAVRAVYKLNPVFDSLSINIFGCGSTLGSILSFVRGEERSFRFGVQRIGETIFFIRKTATPKELIDNVRGYGHSFPEAYTVWEPDVKGSSSHQRIIRYDLGGLKCMIRSECDGYLPSKLSTAHSTIDRHQNDSTSLDPAHISFEDAFAAFAEAHQSARQSDDDDDDKLNIKNAGNEVGQHTVFDLKTRSARRQHEVDLSEFLPRLWANQTPNFILAWHHAGVFDDIEIKDVRSDVARWERSNQALLLKFRTVLEHLLDFSKTRACFEIRRTGQGDLEIWSEIAGSSALPPELRARWLLGEGIKLGKGDAHASS